jgi:DNA invertase Pin-like site-specific DNA recombinase
MNTPSPLPVAYSYVRFSTSEQLKGDSLRRQTDAAAEWCDRNKVRLDTTLSLRDLGVSAFKGKHRSDKHDLGQFLKLVKNGRIPVGAYLLIENLDRLSREEERTALRLWMDILDHGINIVQLTPETIFRHEKSDMFDIMRAIMELSRGHSESAIKSQRLGKAWDAKRAEIGRRKLTGKCPFWLMPSEDRTRFIEKPEAVEVVKRMFRLAREGHGSFALSRRLNEEGVPSPHRKAWNNVSVLSVLRNRAVLGEFTPHRGRPGAREPAGATIADYYPSVISEEEFYAVQAAIKARKNQRGPRGKGVRNLFTELVKDARDSTPMHITEKRKGDFRMISSGAMQGKAGTRYVSFSYPVFERAVLSLLAEVDPREVLAQEDGPDEVSTLQGELAGVETRIADLEAELLDGDVAAAVKALRKLEDKKKDLAEKLAAAKERVAHPLSDSWRECQSLLAVLDRAPDPDESRLRLRSALHRVIDSIRVLVVPRGRDRLAAVQVWFADGPHCRDYLILHRLPQANGSACQEGRWWAKSLASVAEPGDLDLRKRGDVAKLEAALAAVDVNAME